MGILKKLKSNPVTRIGTAVATSGLSETLPAAKKGYDKLSGKTDEEKAAAAAAERRSVQAASDARLKEGLAQGRTRGEELYGMNQEERQKGIKDITRRRREAVDKTGPQATRLRQTRNRREAAARARGASQGQLDQIGRQAESDIANTEYGQYQQNLGSYQKLMGNILKGQQGMEMGYGGLAKSGEQVAMPQQSGGLLGGLGSVVCTELHRQGFMTDAVFEKDQNYGKEMIKNNPDIYAGYAYLAAPVVRLMIKSYLFTSIVSLPGLCWARDMAGDHNLIGKTINYFGNILCGFVGRSRRGKVQKV